MIEFKGECGHTIRARDEDAGKAVRCSYCGREALVAQTARDDLDMLFDEVEKTGLYDPAATKVGHKLHKAQRRAETKATAGKTAGPNFDPFAVAIKMTYVAVIIIAVVVVYKMGMPYVKGVLSDANPSAPDKPDPTAAPVQARGQEGSSRERHGLITVNLNPQQDGAYVSSVPRGAAIYHLPGRGVADSILTDTTANKNMRTNSVVLLKPGQHTIAVALRLDCSELMRRSDTYRSLREEIEKDPGDEALHRRLLAREMMPDTDNKNRVARIRGDLHLVRIYEIEVYAKSWTPVTAIFWPRMAFEEFVTELKGGDNFAFKREYIETELSFYNIPGPAQNDIMRVLSKIGKACYQMPDRSEWRIFQVDLKDGSLTSRRLRQ